MIEPRPTLPYCSAGARAQWIDASSGALTYIWRPYTYCPAALYASSLYIRTPCASLPVVLCFTSNVIRIMTHPGLRPATGAASTLDSSHVASVYLTHALMPSGPTRGTSTSGSALSVRSSTTSAAQCLLHASALANSPAPQSAIFSANGSSGLGCGSKAGSCSVDGIGASSLLS